MELTKTAYEYKETASRTMELCKRKMGEMAINDDEVDGEMLEMMRGMFHMCDLGIELTVKQAETMDEINQKLDKLLELANQ